MTTQSNMSSQFCKLCTIYNACVCLLIITQMTSLLSTPNNHTVVISSCMEPYICSEGLQRAVATHCHPFTGPRRPEPFCMNCNTFRGRRRPIYKRPRHQAYRQSSSPLPRHDQTSPPAAATSGCASLGPREGCWPAGRPLSGGPCDGPFSVPGGRAAQRVVCPPGPGPVPPAPQAKRF